jgi:hypothetical protein
MIKQSTLVAAFIGVITITSTTSIIAAGGDPLYCKCINATDRDMRSQERIYCDGAAACLGYQLCILRPENMSKITNHIS